jgi:hypothetical protein
VLPPTFEGLDPEASGMQNRGWVNGTLLSMMPVILLVFLVTLPPLVYTIEPCS